MKLKLRYDFQMICENLLAEKLKQHGVKYEVDSQGEVHILQNLTSAEKENLIESLHASGIEVIENQYIIIVQKVKKIISDLVKNELIGEDFKISEHIEKELPYSYNYISRVFSEHAHTSIEKFMILTKIDYVKKLLMEGNLSLSEIAFKLNYSSVSHLSKQFKNTTGFNPTYFLNLKKQMESN